MTEDEPTPVGPPPVGYVESLAFASGEVERVMLHSRDGNAVYVRAVDPCDDPEPPRVPIYEGDQLVYMSHLAYVTIHLTPEGDDGYLLPLRIVPVESEPGKTVVRTLRYGERDDGRRIHVRPGDAVEIRPTVDLESIDEFESSAATGYVPITPVLFTWLVLAPQPSDDKPRYLLAAARRLDIAQYLFTRVEDLRAGDHDGAPAMRRAAFELIGATESAVVAMSRAVDMCMNAREQIGTSTPVPSVISSRAEAITAIRNAYEHIEDRALGNVRNKPHPDALTIFEHASVVGDGVIVYGSHRLDLTTDVPDLIESARRFLKSAAGEAIPAPSPPPITMPGDLE